MSLNEMDRIPIRRSYERDVLRPLDELPGGRVTELRKVKYGSNIYPLLAVQYPKIFDHKNPTVLLSAGVDGDEPAGVHASVDFLKEEAAVFSDRLNMMVLPCINPSGFEADSRFTMNGANLNRVFGLGSHQPEVRAIEEYLPYLSGRLRITMDLHENDPNSSDGNEGDDDEENPHACYLYELQHDHHRRIGRQLINALPRWATVCQLPTIEKDINDRGVIAYPEARRHPIFATGPLDVYLWKHYTDHALTFETPTIWSMEQRIEVHRTWIRRALELILSSSLPRGES